MSPWTDNLYQQQQKYEEGWQSVQLQYTVWNAKCKKNENINCVPLTSLFALTGVQFYSQISRHHAEVTSSEAF